MSNENEPTVLVADGTDVHISQVVVAGADNDEAVAVSIGVADDDVEVVILASPPEYEQDQQYITIPMNGLLRAIEVLRANS